MRVNGWNTERTIDSDQIEPFIRDTRMRPLSLVVWQRGTHLARFLYRDGTRESVSFKNYTLTLAACERGGPLTQKTYRGYTYFVYDWDGLQLANAIIG